MHIEMSVMLNLFRFRTGRPNTSGMFLRFNKISHGPPDALQFHPQRMQMLPQEGEKLSLMPQRSFCAYLSEG